MTTLGTILISLGIALAAMLGAVVCLITLPIKLKAVAATVKWDRNETGKNRCAGIRQALPVESFAGRVRIATGLNVENPSLNLTFGCRAGKTGYEPVQDSCQAPRPTSFRAHRTKCTSPETDFGPTFVGGRDAGRGILKPCQQLFLNQQSKRLAM